jgi:hypothetical protein
MVPPGIYMVKVEAQGFKLTELPRVEVYTNRTSTAGVMLQPGAVSETVTVTAEAATVDVGSTALNNNLPDTFYTRVPVQRNVTSLFYVAPGVAPGGASGQANPSISGGSGLENQYVADGVNITDAAFGGIGVFSRVYGSVGTGINLSFIKEVQVKTGGFEPQYGRSTGGIVQIVTKTGSNEFHGALSANAAPKGFELRRRNIDDVQFGRTNLFGRLVHVANYDVAGELGGYVPGLRENVFFFGAFNPSLGQRYVIAPTNSGLFAVGDMQLRTFTKNYAAKATFRLHQNHTFEGSIFGDPASTNRAPFRRLRMDNDTAFSKLEYGTRNIALRYNATLSPTWLFNLSGTWGKNDFNETGFANINEIIDQTQIDPGQRGEFIPVGLGFHEPTESNTYGVNADTSKVVNKLGQHTFSLGYRMERPIYTGARGNSGPTFIVPGLNASGIPDGLEGFEFESGGVARTAVGERANVVWRLLPAPASCTLCPFMDIPGVGPSRVLLRTFRSEFGVNEQGLKSFTTNGRYHAAYVNDSWQLGKHLTVNAGLRWEQQRISGERLSHTFTDNWSPRLGFSIDPTGNRRTKLYGNWGRYTYGIPLDMAERSLTSELDLFGLRIAPDFTTDAAGNRVAVINQFGTVTPIVDAAHVLNGAVGGVANAVAVSESGTPILSGTKMSYQDEWLVGLEHQFNNGVAVSVRFLRRDLKRIVEDVSGISPEAFIAGTTQSYVIGNIDGTTDSFTNPVPHVFPLGGTPPAACTDPSDGEVHFVVDPVTDSLGNEIGAVCFEPFGANGQDVGAVIPDGIPDGFPDPTRRYWAWEFEVNKAFSNNWLMRVNYRIARLFGNFEGALRNDNGQTDPGISSLFDFTQGDFNLLGDQFRPGELNTDRRHVANVYLSYAFDRSLFRGLTLGTGFRVETGTPINRLLAHPAYENQGEVPVGGRGSLGRLPTTHSWDIHADYAVPVSERARFIIGADLFNVTNQRRLTFIDQNADLGFGAPNVDFLKPLNQARVGDAFQQPFNARVSLKFVF